MDSVILFNSLREIYSVPKESNYTVLFLSMNNKNECAPLLFFIIEIYYIRSMFYCRYILSWKKTIKGRFIFETTSNLDIV